jgi:beta-xylosidase
MSFEIINPIIRQNLPDASIFITDGAPRIVATCSEPDLPKVSGQTGRRCHVQMLELDENFKGKGQVHEAMPDLPVWARTDEIWAPQVIRVGEEYLMFFSVGPDENHNESHCGVARSRDPNGPFIPDSRPLVSGPGFTAIDIQAVIAKDGTLHGVFGSGWGPIRIRALRPDGSDWTERSIFSNLRNPNPQIIDESLIEGPEIIYIKETNQYYLLVSGSNTWEPDSYKVMGFVSNNLEGPYQGVGSLNNRDDNAIWRPCPLFDRVGHTTTFLDSAGNHVILGLGVERNNVNDENGKIVREPIMAPIDFINNDIRVNNGTSVTPSRLAIPALPSRRLQYQ